MNRKAIGIAIIIGGAILLIGIIYLLFFKKFNTDTAVQVESKQTVAQTETAKLEEEKIVATPRKPTKPMTKKEVTEDELKRLAMLFAERFGSYSTQSTYQNVVDLKLFMNESMKKWADDYVTKKNNEVNGAGIYYGITTRAVATEVKSFDSDGGKAEIRVATQRREASGTANNATSFGQGVSIKYVKEGGAWKVAEARWEDKQLR